MDILRIMWGNIANKTRWPFHGFVFVLFPGMMKTSCQKIGVDVSNPMFFAAGLLFLDYL